MFRPVLAGSIWLAVVSIATIRAGVAAACASHRAVGDYNKTNL